MGCLREDVADNRRVCSGRRCCALPDSAGLPAPGGRIVFSGAASGAGLLGRGRLGVQRLAWAAAWCSLRCLGGGILGHRGGRSSTLGRAAGWQVMGGFAAGLAVLVEDGRLVGSSASLIMRRGSISSILIFR